tara:strand:- start:17655 stop:17834 length:180 start_codon:yes stop_codon:yes gene_type:complete
MDGKTTIMFPNEGEYDIDTNILKGWEIESCETIADTNFCKTSDSSHFSIPLIEYNKIFK